LKSGATGNTLTGKRAAAVPADVGASSAEAGIAGDDRDGGDFSPESGFEPQDAIVFPTVA